jgi:hypothetical protein
MKKIRYFKEICPLVAGLTLISNAPHRQFVRGGPVRVRHELRKNGVRPAALQFFGIRRLMLDERRKLWQEDLGWRSRARPIGSTAAAARDRLRLHRPRPHVPAFGRDPPRRHVRPRRLVTGGEPRTVEPDPEHPHRDHERRAINRARLGPMTPGVLYLILN